jgi:hypothetical protein
MQESTNNAFVKLASIDVSKHVEKKQNLSYLSWAWAVDQLMRADPTANWEFHEPQRFGETMMVSCTVTAFGKPVKMHLPVMDHRNQAIKNPDAFQVNKNMMRCLVKAIACHGLGLYIYAGEDLPATEDGPAVNQPPRPILRVDDVCQQMHECADLEQLKTIFGNAYKIASPEQQAKLKAKYDEQKTYLTERTAA